MKKIFNILCAATVIAASASFATSCNQPAQSGADTQTQSAAATGSIVYFNIDRVLDEYDMANDLRSVVESKVASINEEVNRRGSKLEKEIKSFQDKINKGLLVSSVAQAQQEKLQQDQANFQNYAAQKQQEIAEEQQVMMNQLADAIKTFVDAYNEEKGYAMILTTSGGLLPAPIVAGDASLDITDDILAGLNAEYVKTKASK